VFSVNPLSGKVFSPTIRLNQCRTVKGTIKIDSLQIRYADGKIDNLPVKETIQEDTDSRWIALLGSDRCVISVIIKGSGTKPSKKPF
jgi:hypothetical protein